MGNGGSKSGVNKFGQYLTKTAEREWVASKNQEIKQLEAKKKQKPLLSSSIDSQIAKAKKSIEERKAKYEAARELLKEKSKPEGIDEALKKVNFDDNGKQRETRNCQRCVIAYELRRRGYKVEADKWDGWGNGANSWNWKKALGLNFKNIGAANRKQTLPKICEIVQSWGDGARGIIGVDWKSSGGHVFNVENVKGKVVMVDAQTGKYVNWDVYNTYAKPTSIDIARADDKSPTADLWGIIRKGKK